MADQVFPLEEKNGKLWFGPQYVYGSKSVLTEDQLPSPKPVVRDVDVGGGVTKSVETLVVGKGAYAVHYIRGDDLP